MFATSNNNRMEPFAGIEAFARVVETGSFTGAAERLQTAKSSISETVRALEERLGVRLLDRTTRSVRPTEAGLAFYARCRRLLDDAEAARAEIQAAQDRPVGLMRIAAPDGFAERYIVPSLTGFLALYPGIDFELVESASAAKLVDERIDLAIRIVDAPEQTLVVRRIGTSRVVVVAAPAYLATAGTPQKPADLAHHRCIGFAPLVWRDTWVLGGEAVGIRAKLLTDSTEALRAAALAGVGIAALPEWMVADALASGALARVLGDYAAKPSGIYAVYPTNRLMTPKIRLFVDYLAHDLRARGLSD
jgi:DNA-binding transcriptional LysR family regulator